MGLEAKVSIDFYEQTKASVFLETTVSGNDEHFAENLLYSLFTIRQLINLRSYEESKTYADVLIRMGAQGSGLGELLDKEELRLVKYQGHKGRKGFAASVIYDGPRKLDTELSQRYPLKEGV